MRRFGLIGYPLSHSFSKKFFSEKFERENIEAAYDLFPISNIGELPALLSSSPQLEGLNVTIPYKKQVMDYLHHTTEAVRAMSACNCIKIVDGKLHGYNTDVFGFEESLLPYLKPYHKKALILGTGGAAAAVEYVLQKLDIEYLFVSRNKEGRSGTVNYAEVDERMMNEYLLIINSSPLGMYPKVDECPEIPYEFVGGRHYFYDLVYNPAKTLFLQKAEEKGAIIKNGEEMLILQAEESWRIWNRPVDL